MAQHVICRSLWGVITAKIHTPYSIIRGGGVSEVGGFDTKIVVQSGS